MTVSNDVNSGSSGNISNSSNSSNSSSTRSSTTSATAPTNTTTIPLTSSSSTVPTNNIVNLPTPYETSYERIDLIPLKKQLDNVLKDRSEDYWEWIRRFLAGKLSKRELDYYVQTNLTENHLHLHNQFFKAVIFNAFYSKTPPPAIVESKAASSLLDKKRKQPSSTIKPSKKDSKKKKEGVSTSAPSSTTSATATATATSSAPTPTPVTSGSVSLSSSSSSIKNSKKPSKTTRKPTTLSSSSSSTKPISKKKHYPKYSLYASQVETLKEKMELIASEHGIEKISTQSIVYMKLALEQHILNFVNRVNPHIISKNIKPSPQPNQIIPQEYLNSGNNYNSNINSSKINYNSSSNSNYNSSNINSSNINSNSNSNYNSNSNSNNSNNSNNGNSNNSNSNNSNNSNSNNNTNINVNNNNNSNIGNNIDVNIQVDTNNISNSNINKNTIINDNSNITTNNNIINNRNNNNNNIKDIKTFKFSDVFNFNKSPPDLKINYPKYIESNNPYLSQPSSFYKIPDNIFSTSYISNSNFCESIITTQDIFTMVEESPCMLIDDPLLLERLNLLRY